MKLLLTGRTSTLAPQHARAASAVGTEVVAWDRARLAPDDSAAARAISFVFTSTAMVFHYQPDGPHAVDAPRNAQDDDGHDQHLFGGGKRMPPLLTLPAG